MRSPHGGCRACVHWQAEQYKDSTLLLQLLRDNLALWGVDVLAMPDQARDGDGGAESEATGSGTGSLQKKLGIRL